MNSRIEKVPGKCGGLACVKGHRLTVRHLAWYDREGWTAEETAGMFPGVDPDDIEAAWAYAKEHPEEMVDEPPEEPPALVPPCIAAGDHPCACCLKMSKALGGERS